MPDSGTVGTSTSVVASQKMPRLQGWFGLSNKAYHDLKQAIAACTLTDLTLMASVVISFLAVLEVLNPLLNAGDEVSWSRLLTLLGCGILVAVAVFLCSRYDYKKTYKNSYLAAEEARLNVAETLRKLPMSFFNRHELAELATTIMGDCATIEHALSHVLPQLCANIITCTTACVILAVFDWRMALAMFATLPLALGVILLSRRRQERFSAQHKTVKLRCAAVIQEYLDGIKLIKSLNLAGKSFDALDESLREIRHYSLKMELSVGILVSGAQFVLTAGQGITILVGAALLLSGKIALTTLILTLLLSVRIYGPIVTILTLLPELFHLRTASARMRSLDDEEIMQGDPDLDVANGDICLDGVSFAYEGKLVLHELNARAARGTVTALVGPSGSGKSTMTRLIARFWDVDKGRITLDDHDIREYDPERFMQQMSFVFQDVILFNDTIYNNIAIGRLGSTPQEVHAAAKAAHCDDFIEALPQGFDTMLGENGMTLSGGQRQRISIARALLKDAPIILLDEATASLDPESEGMVQKAISTLIGDKTVIVIAHRLNTIREVDLILTLKDGTIAEAGTHAELLAKNGLYHELCSYQEQAANMTVRQV
jgi:ATP-binding cassette subfamily B protein